jgi:hypothetical protein
MATILQLRRGTTVQHSSFTGAVGEVTVDTTKDTIVVHDGTTQGGFPLAKESALSGFISLTALSGGTGLDYNNTTGVFDIDSTVATKTYVDNAILTKDNTDEITEGSTNLYFTNARARGAVSVTDSGGDGSLAYNSTTGVITYTGPSASDVRAHFSASTGISITNGAISTTITQYTDALARGAVSAGTGLSYNSSTGVFTNSITQYTDALARASVSVTDSGGDGSLSYNNTTGVITYTGPSASDVRAHFSAGTGVTISSGQVSIGQAVGTSSNVTFNDVTVSGNLTVSGTTTTVNTETINLADNIITLNSNEAGTPSQNAGIEVERGTSTNVAFQWNETTDVWEYTVDGTNYIPVVGTTATQTLTNKTISGSSNTLSNIANSSLTNSSITINGTAVSLGGSVSNLALTTGKLSQFAATTSAELLGVISDETGSGALVFANTPTLVTPNIGAATGTSLTTTGGGVLSRQAATQDGIELRGRAGGTGNWEAILTPTTLSADRTFTFPDVSGTVVTTGDTGSVTNTMLAGSIANAKLANSAITLAGTSVSLGGAFTATNMLDAIKTVDGAGSGLDADLLDGNSSAYFRINIYDSAGTLLN